MNNSHPSVLPSGGARAAAARRRHRAKQHRGYIGREKSGLLRVSAYILPAASRDAARRAWGNRGKLLLLASCNCRIGAVTMRGAGGAGPWTQRPARTVQRAAVSDFTGPSLKVGPGRPGRRVGCSNTKMFCCVRFLRFPCQQKLKGRHNGGCCRFPQ
jgi:hypothetical protein